MLSPIDFFITPSCADQLLRRKLSYRKCSGPVSIVSRRISFCKRRMCPSRVAPGEQRTRSHEQNQDDSSKRAVCACSLDLRLPSHLPAALPAARTRCRPERPRISTCLLRRNFRQGSRFGEPRGTARISGGKGLHFLRAILCVWILAE